MVASCDVAGKVHHRHLGLARSRGSLACDPRGMESMASGSTELEQIQQILLDVGFQAAFEQLELAIWDPLVSI